MLTQLITRKNILNLFVFLLLLGLLFASCQQTEPQQQVPVTAEPTALVPEAVEEAPAPPTRDAEDVVQTVPAAPPHTTEHPSPLATARPSAPLTTPTPEDTPAPAVITSTIYVVLEEGEMLDATDGGVVVYFLEGGFFGIFANATPEVEETIVASYLFDESWADQAGRDTLYACAMEGAEDFIDCLENPIEDAETAFPIVPVTGEFDGPDCDMAIDEIMVIVYEEYNTIDMVVHPDQGAVTWSSTDMPDEDFRRQHSYRNSDGCSVLTLGHNPEHNSGINFVVKNSNNEVIWDQDIWLGN